MIRLRGVRRRFGTGPSATEVLRGVDLDIEAGEFVALVGRSGSGKTTLLNTIGGLDTGYEGDVEIDGRRLKEFSDREVSEFRNRRVGFVFQAFHLLDHQTCLENAALPALFARHDFDATARARVMLERLGIAEKAEVMPNVLSGGQKQRVAIARALLMEPALLICDEPTGNLDHETGLAILKVFSDIHREQGVTLVIVTHDDTIAAAAHRRIVLDAGVIREDVRSEAES